MVRAESAGPVALVESGAQVESADLVVRAGSAGPVASAESAGPAVLLGSGAVIGGMQVEPLQINFMVGQAFAIAAASYFPLLFMSTWWRKMTMPGAAAGMLTGGCLVYLGCLDVLFNLNGGNYRIAGTAMLAEIVINVGSFSIGAGLIAWAWRHREALLQR